MCSAREGEPAAVGHRDVDDRDDPAGRGSGEELVEEGLTVGQGAGLADDRDVLLVVEHAGNGLSDDGVVVDEHHADPHG